MGRDWNIWSCSALRRPVTRASYQCIKTPDGPRQTLLSRVQGQDMRKTKTHEIPSDHKMEQESTLSTVRGVRYWNGLWKKVVEISKPTQLDTVLNSLLWLTELEQREFSYYSDMGKLSKSVSSLGIWSVVIQTYLSSLDYFEMRKHFQEDVYPDVLILCSHLVNCSAFPFTLVNHSRCLKASR